MNHTPTAVRDRRIVSEINRRTGAGLTMTGRSLFGRLGGAVYAEWPDGRPAVVTRFLGSLAEARRTAGVLAHVRDSGLPVPRHELVVQLDDGVFFVQERLPSASPQRLSPARMEAIVGINDRFADALAARPEVPAPPQCSPRGGGSDPRHEVLAGHGPRSRRVLEQIVRITERAPDGMVGADLVHVDLSGANVLFDESGAATGVVDWNLGAYRGDRLFALVQTRFDREWFVRSPDADPVETAAAFRLDEILAERIPPDTLRLYWAWWMLRQLARAIRTASPEAVDWHLDLAESRLGLRLGDDPALSPIMGHDGASRRPGIRPGGSRRLVSGAGPRRSRRSSSGGPSAGVVA
ncbi:phosphotransferase [Glycomyces tenuis]|uniref:phosphotransferase n=1 Tax=Glycomyces tenuis TaxID=58116 RepID=UPI00040177AC|nr:phosphotransferase [Glycomyces tenuis]